MDQELRDRIVEAADRSDPQRLLLAVRQALASGTSMADLLFAAGKLSALGEQGSRAAGLLYLRTYVVRSLTVEPFLPYLQLQCAQAGLYLDIRLSSHGSLIDDLTNPSADLCRFQPDLVLLLLDIDAYAGGLYAACASGSADAVSAVAGEAAQHVERLLTAFRHNSAARVMVQGLVLPNHPALGDVSDANLTGTGELAAVAEINRVLASTCRKIGDAVYFDQDRIAARHSRAGWRDARMFYMVRLGVAAKYFEEYTGALVRSIRALYVPPRKLLCTDLDGTVWGGAVGEDGPHGIETGAAFPGNCYLAYQHYLRGLSQRGILLAICSKNDEADVLEAFRVRARDLGVRLGDFVSRKIGWGDKAAALRAMASELSLGLDSFVFVDDSPVECAAIRQQLPEVAVVQASANQPWALADQISSLGLFDTLGITVEDRTRTREYQLEARRAELRESAGTREDFLSSLQIVCTFTDGLGPFLPRTIQLINKTNQFNLTTRGYSIADLEQLSTQAGAYVVALRARDRFGDSGIVGIAICAQVDECCYIDTFLLSCRVLGQGMESALIAYVASCARNQRAARLIGMYVPSRKNHLAADFYAKHGFAIAELTDGERAAGAHGFSSDKGMTGIFYELDLRQDALPQSPAWIVLEDEIASRPAEVTECAAP